MTYSLLFAGLWGVWMVSWGVAAAWASKPAAQPPNREELFQWGVLTVGSVLLFLNFRTGRRDMLWSTPDAYEWALFVLAVAGLVFTWWARIHLGTLWSGRVTRKADHRIVDTGTFDLQLYATNALGSSSTPYTRMTTPRLPSGVTTGT